MTVRPLPTRYLELDGGRIAYDDTEGDGQLVVCTPGLGDNRTAYRHLRPLLTAARYRVVTSRLTVASRTAWALLGVFLLAFAVFEAVKHAGWAIGLGLAGLIGPDLTLLIGIDRTTAPGQLARRAVPCYNVAHHWLLPLAVLLYCLLLYFGLFTETNDQAAPGFTLGLAWLAHISVDRALGYGLRTKDGWQRSKTND